MEKRTRTVLLVASAVAVSAAAALLLLRTGPGEGAGTDPATHRQLQVGTDGGTLPSRTPRSPSAAGVGGLECLPAADGPPRLEIRAEVEGGFGLADVLVLPLVRDADGEIGAWIGEDAPECGSTGADGCITIRYKLEPGERLFGFLEDRELAAAGNAEPAGTLHRFKVYRAAGAGPVTLRFRDPEGLVLLRPVDAATGEVLSNRPGIVFVFKPPYGHGMDEERETGVREREPGWIQAPGNAAGAPADLRLLVPGYLPAPAPVGGWKGRVVLPLERDSAAVRGRILVPEGWTASAVLLRASDGQECTSMELVGVPEAPGPFAMSGVPKGESELVVQAWRVGRAPEDVQWASVRFDNRGGGLDLGELRPQPGAVVRARLLSKEGTPVTDAPLLLAQAVPGAIPDLVYQRRARDCTVNVSYGRSFLGREPGDRDPGEDGWAEFRGLRPGATFLLATPRIPGLTRVVEAPRKPGETVAVELDGGCRMTSCILHFTVGGEQPGSWRYFFGPAFTEDFSTGKGLLEAEIPPGRYRFSAEFTEGPDSDPGSGRAEVEIPDTGRYEATVDLKAARR